MSPCIPGPSQSGPLFPFQPEGMDLSLWPFSPPPLTLAQPLTDELDQTPLPLFSYLYNGDDNSINFRGLSED